MAKIQILGPGVLKGISSFPRELAVKMGNRAESNVRRTVTRTVRRHWRNAITQVAQKLAPGGIEADPGTQTTGRKRINFLYVDGRPGRVTTKRAWQPLSKRYLQRKRVKRYWYQHGLVYQSFLLHSDEFKKVDVNKIKPNRNHHKGRVNTAYEIVFPRMGYPYDRALVGSYTTLKLSTIFDYKKDFNRRALDRASFPERQRPFIGDLAVMLGKDHLKALRNLR